MQAIMEPIFEIAYLVCVVTLGVLILRMAGGEKQFKLFGVMAVVLGCGNAFHLVPRIYALLTDGLANHAAALGFGKLVTSITMTVFYVLLYHVWQQRYGEGKMPALTAVVYLLAAVRVKQFFSITIPLIWTNIRTTLTFFIISTINLSFLLVNAMTGGGPDGATEVFLSYMYKQAYTNSSFGYGMAIGVVVFTFSFALSAVVNAVTKRDVVEL